MLILFLIPLKVSANEIIVEDNMEENTITFNLLNLNLGDKVDIALEDKTVGTIQDSASKQSIADKDGKAVVIFSKLNKNHDFTAEIKVVRNSEIIYTDTVYTMTKPSEEGIFYKLYYGKETDKTVEMQYQSIVYSQADGVDLFDAKTNKLIETPLKFTINKNHNIVARVYNTYKNKKVYGSCEKLILTNKNKYSTYSYSGEMNKLIKKIYQTFYSNTIAKNKKLGEELFWASIKYQGVPIEDIKLTYKYIPTKKIQEIVNDEGNKDALYCGITVYDGTTTEVGIANEIVNSTANYNMDAALGFISTILHESRHCLQYNYTGNNEAYVTKLEETFESNMSGRISDGKRYFGNFLETDARDYACALYELLMKERKDIWVYFRQDYFNGFEPVY